MSKAAGSLSRGRRLRDEVPDVPAPDSADASAIELASDASAIGNCTTCL